MLRGVSDASAPTTDIDGARAAHQALLRTVRTLRDADIGRSSRLPDWTMGHVLTHLARNADGHCNMFAGAAQGEVFAQYPGGMAQRIDEIEMGARRSAAEIGRRPRSHHRHARSTVGFRDRRDVGDGAMSLVRR